MTRGHVSLQCHESSAHFCNKTLLSFEYLLWYPYEFSLICSMNEQRGRQHHRQRIGEALKEEIGALLEGELGDPRVGLCHVNEILLAPDGKSARVFIHVDGDDAEAKETLEALTNAKGFIRRELLIRLGKRHIPELI